MLFKTNKMNTSTHNRNQAFVAISAHLPEKRRRVFQLILTHPNSTAQELAQKTMLPINEITGRITELKNAFLVVETGSKTNRQSNKKNTAYRVVESMEERVDLINYALKKLCEQRLALEEDFGLDISRYSFSLIQKEILKIKSRQRSIEKILENIKQFRNE